MKKNILTEIRTKFDEKILEIRIQIKILKRALKTIDFHASLWFSEGIFFLYF